MSVAWTLLDSRQGAVNGGLKMKLAWLTLVGMMVFVGCSKDGAKSRLLEGGQLNQEIVEAPAAPEDEEEREPTDKNFPEPGEK